MLLYLFFISGLTVLFFLSQQLSRELSRFFFRLFKSQTVVIQLLSFLFLPGVVVHEMAHLLVANVLGVQTGEVEFLPEIHGDEVKMGSVQIASTDPLRRFLVGVAPLLVGLFVLLVSFWYLHGNPIASWPTILLLYIVFQVSNTMFSSRKDMEGAAGFLVVVALCILIPLILRVQIPQSVIAFFVSPTLLATVSQLVLYIFIAVAIDVVVLLLLLGAAKLKKRR